MHNAKPLQSTQRRAPSDSDAPERLALLGVFVNAALAAGKLLVGILGNSYALIADAVESMGDILGSLVIWGALRYGGRPPDDEHPFGHGKAESLAALGVALLLIIAGLGIAASALLTINEPRQPPAAFTLIALIIIVAIKEAMYRIASRGATRTGSSAGLADAWHHRSDAITSAAAFTGILIAILGGPSMAIADQIAALVAAAIIILNGLRLLPEPYRELMDRDAPDIATQCAQIVITIDGIRAIERCHARKVGRVYRVAMHAEVDPHMPVSEAHALTGIAKARVREQLPTVASLLIHIEPHQHTNPTPH